MISSIDDRKIQIFATVTPSPKVPFSKRTLGFFGIIVALNDSHDEIIPKKSLFAV